MSILVIGVGYAGSRVAEKINQEKINGVNCAIVVSRFESVDYSTITKGVNIWDGQMRHPGVNGNVEKRLAEDNIDLIKSLIIEGTSKDWSLENV